MLRLLADENINEHVIRGLLSRQPDLDIIRVRDLGLEGLSDPKLLAWAADHDRIILTCDRKMARDAYRRIDEGSKVAGVLMLRRRLSVREAIEQVLLVVQCSRHEEWAGQVSYLPL